MSRLRITDGFSLYRMEMLNWGNFQGWQVIDFCQPGLSLGPLFDPSKNSLIAGINGSGKSTLIDGIMSVLLPFESSLKLGVTHDFEEGKGGGRCVRDYVLGKYSSTGEEFVQNESDIFSRRTGSSILLLVFRHNSNSERIVSLGRVWWYSGGKLRSESLCWVGYEQMTIAGQEGLRLVDETGSVYPTARSFREGVRAKSQRVQIFDRMGAYFESMSHSLGGVTRDDLKILNLAFYMKSVTRIDAFIRQYMLVARENESMDSLVENVGNAAEISQQIENCQMRLKQSRQVIASLQEYKDNCDEKKRLDRIDHLLVVYPQWLEKHRLCEELKKTEQQRQKKQLELPGAQERSLYWQGQWERLQSQLAHNQGALTLRSLEREKQHISENLNRLNKLKSQAELWVHQLQMSFPQSVNKFSQLKEALENKLMQIHQHLDELNQRQNKYAIEQNQLQNETNEVRSELQFLVEHPTLISRALYEVKRQCQEALKLDSGQLQFVGELIRIKPDCEKYRRAVEMALQPISQNLLCDPLVLDQVTNWLNRTLIGKTLTVKRIQKEQLKGISQEDFIKQVDADSVLSKIEIKPATETIFCGYLHNWLLSHYDFKIVTSKQLKSCGEQAVTLEGLVKLNLHTMRKYKQDIPFQLGWDNRDKQEQLIARLHKIDQLSRQAQHELKQIAEQVRVQHEQVGVIERVRDMDASVFEMPHLKERLVDIERQRIELTKQDTDFAQLQSESDAARLELGRIQKVLSGLESWLENCNEEVERKTQALHKCESEVQEFFREWLLNPLSQMEDRESQFESNRSEENPQSVLLSSEPIDQKAVEEKAESYWMKDLTGRLDESGLTLSQWARQIKGTIKQIEKRLQNSKVQVQLENYRHRFEDPNLNYHFASERELPELLTQWQEMADEIENTGLPAVKEKWEQFYNSTLLDSVKSAINEIRFQQKQIQSNILSINRVLKLTDFEKLSDESRYLQISTHASMDDRIREFTRDLKRVEQVISRELRVLEPDQASQQVVKVLEGFVNTLTKDSGYRDHVIDGRNHFRFSILSYRRGKSSSDDVVVEQFSGARKDAKSSAQTTQLAYSLLASSLAYRFNFYDPVLGKDSLRLIILDEFGGKFDNEKPKDILSLFDDMGFQSILVSPMAKADLLAQYIGQLVLVHKGSAKESKVMSYPVNSYEEYQKLLEHRQHEQTAVGAQM